MALPAAWYAVKKRGLATGIVSGGIGGGLFLSGIILPPIIAAFGKDGWRYAWFFMGIVVFVMAFICYTLLRDHPEEKGLSIYGGEERRKAAPKTAFFSSFRKVMANPELWKLGCVYFMFGFSYVIYLTFFVAYLTTEMGVSTLTAGRMFAVLGILSIFCGVIYGGISDVLGRRWGSMLAYLTLSLSYSIFALWKDPTGFYVSAGVFGFAAFAVPTIMAAASGDAMGGRLAPAGLGFITLFFGIGQALGPVIGGWIKDSTGSFTYAFLLSAAVSLLGAAASILLKRKSSNALFEGDNL